LNEGCSQDEVGFQLVREELDGLFESVDGSVHISGGVEAEAEEIEEARRTGLEFEGSAKALDGAGVLVLIAEPGSHVGVVVGGGMGAELVLQRLGAGAGCAGRGGEAKGCSQDKPADNEPGVNEHAFERPP
jgi:hypothetical protein